MEAMTMSVSSRYTSASGTVPTYQSGDRGETMDARPWQDQVQPIVIKFRFKQQS